MRKFHLNSREHLLFTPYDFNKLYLGSAQHGPLDICLSCGKRTPDGPTIRDDIPLECPLNAPDDAVAVASTVHILHCQAYRTVREIANIRTACHLARLGSALWSTIPDLHTYLTALLPQLPSVHWSNMDISSPTPRTFPDEILTAGAPCPAFLHAKDLQSATTAVAKATAKRLRGPGPPTLTNSTPRLGPHRPTTTIRHPPLLASGPSPARWSRP